MVMPKQKTEASYFCSPLVPTTTGIIANKVLAANGVLTATVAQPMCPSLCGTPPFTAHSAPITLFLLPPTTARLHVKVIILKSSFQDLNRAVFSTCKAQLESN